ncbi:GNAT family N-acetyltransferase [Myceligenerans salitolerans]|uniref:GNAT family N-acetyltransferase n=1 Tax=Myceligenerans salitolerans TaxID=1230528 RepID=A0ABS3IBP1_9MICO|nr:GNAT family N-acetyltransferase [Myceligenerans salitolerans]MBO0610413.1 GNAT family N-acetyltransferase [Myceligenerans salitolerans]
MTETRPEHSPALAVRAATLADVGPLVTLVTSAYRGEASRAGWTTEADLLDGDRIDPDLLRADITRPHSKVLVVDDDARPLACAHVAVEEGAGYFGMFAVRPDRQGGGVGRALLAEAERVARDEWGQTCLRMSVIDARADLVAWYVRRGYVRTGRVKPFPYGDTRFGVPKRDDLRFEVLEKQL